ncbi:TPA: hypothetical protein ACNBBG_003394, partial [Legionella pneumophila]
SHKKSLYHIVLDQLAASEQWGQYFANYKDPRCYFEKNDYKNLLIDTGLSISNIEEQEMTYYYSSVDELKSFLRASNNQLKYVPENLKELFLKQFVQKYLDGVSLKDNEKGIPLIFNCLQVTGNKLNECLSQEPTFLSPLK